MHVPVQQLLTALGCGLTRPLLPILPRVVCVRESAQARGRCQAPAAGLISGAPAVRSPSSKALGTRQGRGQTRCTWGPSSSSLDKKGYEFCIMELLVLRKHSLLRAALR